MEKKIKKIIPRFQLKDIILERDTVLKFGKFNGYSVDEIIDTDYTYLFWLQENTEYFLSRKVLNYLGRGRCYRNFFAHNERYWGELAFLFSLESCYENLTAKLGQNKRVARSIHDEVMKEITLLHTKLN